MSVKRPDNVVNFGCLHPRIVKDRLGNEITVPCRRCAYCLMHRSQILSSLGSLESLTSPYILFVTTTFTNENIPKASYIIEDLNSHSIVHEGKTIEFKVPHSKIVFYDKSSGEILDTLLTTNFTVRYVKNTSSYYHKRFPQSFADDQIPVLKKSDAQKFIKRVRTQFFRKYGKRSSFRILYCGEYGPTTARPHFHFLFFCSSLLERARLYQLIRSSLYTEFPLWSYGRVDAKYFKGKGCGYLTSYMQGLTTLSDVHSRSLFRCFCAHSVRFGTEAFLSKYSDIQTKRSSNYRSFHFIVDGKQSEYNLCSTLENTFYPKCRSFYGLPFNQLFKRYYFAFRYFQTCRWIKNASQLTDFIIQEIKDFQENGVHMPLYCSVFGYNFTDINTSNIRNIVYYDCLISCKFLKNKPKHISFRRYLSIIIDYYKNKDLHFKELDMQSQGFLENDLHDYVAANYFINDKQIDTEHLGALTDYRSSQSFKDWKRYNYMRLYDASKMKKFKDFYSNKFYSNKEFFNQLKLHSTYE